MNQSEHFERLGTAALAHARSRISGSRSSSATRRSARSASRAPPRKAVSAEADARLLTTIAANVGAAIQNARLYSESQRRAGEMAALAEVGREITATLDLSAVLQRIAERAANLLEAHTAAVFLRRHRTARRSAATAAVGDDRRRGQANIHYAGEGIIGTLAAEGRAEVINDAYQDPRGAYPRHCR